MANSGGRIIEGYIHLRLKKISLLVNKFDEKKVFLAPSSIYSKSNFHKSFASIKLISTESYFTKKAER